MASGTIRQLILLRHAKSAWPNDVPDHERPLAPRGRRDAPAAGRWLRKSGYAPDRVLCSTARRARETWKLAEEAFGAQPQTVFEERVYGASTSALLDLARETPVDVGVLLIVGHDPAMQGLTLELASAQPSDKEARVLGLVRVKYPTAAIAVLSFSGSWADLSPGEAHLGDFVVPGDLHGNRRDSGS
jgi:phosphohistidine phosphatase